MKYRLTKIYTKTGDNGLTGLAGGARVRKDSARIEAYGNTDELNAVLGLALAYAQKEKIPARVRRPLEAFLKQVQNELFNLGADLASPIQSNRARKSMITEDHVRHLERHIDEWQKELKPLKEFILRGGGVISSWLHFACTVARRTERAVVTLVNQEKIDPANLRYLNRLNDALFVLARWTAKKLGQKEILWQWDTLKKHYK
ncbi:MAG: cob(I)yrinic acid a,c-diamide adenosyltransferase [Candidatus Omnitrophica bacterium]|nr:cob(I)yrinic acid a,c-diamide adenosyltransferase [Candidatus Omnitrophota bacterium]